MLYHILFCLSAEDTGTILNPALVPILDDSGEILTFRYLDDAFKTVNRLRRVAEGLVYYATALIHVSEPLKAQPEPAVRENLAAARL